MYTVHIFKYTYFYFCIFSRLIWFNKDIEQNSAQMRAVTNIVNLSKQTVPYLLFGPPGTGKTKTLVEAICQIHKTKPDSRILVCATSNAAANEIAIRLLKCFESNGISDHKLYRLYAKCAVRNVLNPMLQENSNYGLNKLPPLRVIQSQRIIITTLVVAGVLKLRDISPKHFDYLIIDESGSATQSALLIPVAGKYL